MVAAVSCSFKTAVALYFLGSWRMLEKREGCFAFYKTKKKSVYSNFLPLLIIASFYLNSFKITAKLVIINKLFYKSNLQETKLLILYLQF